MMNPLHHINIRVASPVMNKLGEGVMWDATHNSVCWVDILNHRMYRYHLGSAETEAIDTSPYPSALAPTSAGACLIAFKGGVGRLTAGDKFEQLSEIEANQPFNRCNDGKCDPQGRFWIGTMAMDEAEGSGSVYRVDNDLKPKRIIENLTISNGMAWDSRKSLFYHIDTPTRSIFAYDYEPISGTINDKRLVIRFADSAGWPDGMTIDDDGKLWVAMWDGWSILCVDPEVGRLVAAVRFPVARPTNCTFGGFDLGDLYVTTATTGLTASDLRKQPDAGRMFVVTGLGVNGITTTNFNDNE